MGFFRTRTIAGRPYTYFEERWRENGKVRSRSTIVRGGSHKVALETYRDAIRQNAYTFGRSRSAARYQSEAQAREAYLRELDAAKYLASPQHAEEERQQAAKDSAFESRARGYAVGHSSPEYRAKEEYMANREAVRAEDERLNASEASYPSKGSPTDADEALNAQWSDNQAAQFDEDLEEYTTWANEQDVNVTPEAEEQAPEASDSQDQDIQADTPDV